MSLSPKRVNPRVLSVSHPIPAYRLGAQSAHGLNPFASRVGGASTRLSQLRPLPIPDIGVMEEQKSGVYEGISRLRRRRAELVRRREGAVERAAFFPSPVNQRHLEDLDRQLLEIDERLRELGVAP